jgi:hypothetical protein
MSTKTNKQMNITGAGRGRIVKGLSVDNQILITQTYRPEYMKPHSVEITEVITKALSACSWQNWL